MPVSEVPLKDGLKWMFTLATVMLNLKSRGTPEEFDAAEDEVVELFLKGLEKNGYEIRPIDEQAS